MSEPHQIQHVHHANVRGDSQCIHEHENPVPRDHELPHQDHNELISVIPPSVEQQIQQEQPQQRQNIIGVGTKGERHDPTPDTDEPGKLRREVANPATSRSNTNHKTAIDQNDYLPTHPAPNDQCTKPPALPAQDGEQYSFKRLLASIGKEK